MNDLNPYEDLHQSVFWRRQLLNLLVTRYNLTYTEAIDRIAQMMPYDA